MRGRGQKEVNSCHEPEVVKIKILHKEGWFHSWLTIP